MTALRTLSMGLSGILCLTLVTADPAEAGKDAKGKKGSIFAKLDANNDNQISRQEFEKFGKGKAGKLFDKLDADKNGSLSKAEFNNLAQLKKKKNKN